MNKKIITLLICVLVVAAVIAILQWRSSSNWGSDEAQNAFENAASEENMDGYINAVEEELSNSEPQSGSENSTDTLVTQAETPSNAVTEEPRATYTPQVDENGNLMIGDPNAHVTIHEYSSLTCPHCASFHEQTLPSVKTDYIDTGKAKFVFHDFPLNRQAMMGSLLLKCAQPQQRYELMEMLFDQQSQWAFESNFEDKLKQYAALIGISNEKAEECMNDAAAEREMLVGMKQASETYKISSTPSFVVMPGNTLINGAVAYGSFSTAIEGALEE